MNRYRMVVRSEKQDGTWVDGADLELDDKGPLVLYEAHVAELGALKQKIRDVINSEDSDGRVIRRIWRLVEGQGEGML